MKNGGKLKTENNLYNEACVYNEACDDGNVDVQSKRQAIGFNLCLFYNDLSSLFRKKVFRIDIAVIHTGIQMALRYLKK